MPPVTGGIERLMHRLGGELCSHFECHFVGPRGCRTFLPGHASVLELPHRPAPLFLALAALVVPWLCLRRRIDRVLAGNGLMALVVTPPSRLLRIPVTTMVYGLDIVASNRVYRLIGLPMIRASAAVVACSRNTARLAAERGVPAARLHVVTPAVDMPPDSARPPDPSPAQAPATLISIGRLVRRKGLADFIRHCLPVIVARRPDVQLRVIGAAAEAALQREASEPQRIDRAIADTGLARHVTMLGHVPDESLARELRAAWVHIFPVQDIPGDVEGFGLVALEAAAVGVPTVAFAAGGVTDAVEDGVSGRLLEPGDYPGFADAVCALFETDRVAMHASCKAYAAARSWPGYAKRIAGIIDATGTAPRSTGSSA